MERPPGRPNLALADFVMPRENGRSDYFGMFAVTTGIGIEVKVQEFEMADDDYSAILLKSLADRLAEAFAERLHERVRREFWGYAPDEAFSGGELAAESYRGIRPAPGYPACPDHTQKELIFKTLGATEFGMALTETFAMRPAASVSGFYFGHPEVRYFGLGRINADQVADYAARKGMTVAEAESWLAMSLGYERE
jgi:5-methyltetrahydrofolate--homocysteine methyltransferase